MRPLDPLPHAQVYIPQTLRKRLNRSRRNLLIAVCGLSSQVDVGGPVKSLKMVGSCELYEELWVIASVIHSIYNASIPSRIAL